MLITNDDEDAKIIVNAIATKYHINVKDITEDGSINGIEASQLTEILAKLKKEHTNKQKPVIVFLGNCTNLLEENPRQKSNISSGSFHDILLKYARDPDLIIIGQINSADSIKKYFRDHFYGNIESIPSPDQKFRECFAENYLEKNRVFLSSELVTFLAKITSPSSLSDLKTTASKIIEFYRNNNEQITKKDIEAIVPRHSFLTISQLYAQDLFSSLTPKDALFLTLITVKICLDISQYIFFTTDLIKTIKINKRYKNQNYQANIIKDENITA